MQRPAGDAGGAAAPGDDGAGDGGAQGSEGGDGAPAGGSVGTGGEGEGEGPSGGGGGLPGEGEGPGGGEGEGAGEEGGPGPPPCDPDQIPGEGVYVASDGSDEQGDGSPLHPLATIMRGLFAGLDGAPARVILATGRYPERIRMDTHHAGARIEGGWRRVGATWRRVCEAGARDLTLIESPKAVGVTIEGLLGAISLATLTVATKPRGETVADRAGESCVGVLVRGGAATVTLEDVVVVAGDGGDGGDGAPGRAGADGVAGVFAEAGHAPGDGEPGVPGEPGRNGQQGGPGEGGNCFPGGRGCPSPDCSTEGERRPAAGNHGTCGCGGAAGVGGASGRGGGASVAVLAVGPGVVVTIAASHLEAGDGGHGTGGRPGTSGEAGGAGAAGAGMWCNGECSRGGPNCLYDGCHQGGNGLAGGAAGGPAGRGGDGAAGGDGAGGPSHAVVTVGGARVELVRGSTLRHGVGGPGGSDAPAGLASPTATVD